MRHSTTESENRPKPPRQLRRAVRPDTVFLSPTWEAAPVGKTFREVYCARHQIAPERYEIDLFVRCLPWRARLLRPLLSLLKPQYFDIDLTFVRNIGAARDAGILTAEIKEFRYDSRNMTWARNRMRIRLSTNRLLEVARELMPHLAPSAPPTVLDGFGSQPPFGLS